MVLKKLKMLQSLVSHALKRHGSPFFCKLAEIPIPDQARERLRSNERATHGFRLIFIMFSISQYYDRNNDSQYAIAKRFKPGFAHS